MKIIKESKTLEWKGFKIEFSWEQEQINHPMEREQIWCVNVKVSDMYVTTGKRGERGDQFCFSGIVKWDGCSNWNKFSNCVHFCDAEEAMGLFETIYNNAREIMKEIDLTGDNR